jgi:hypothetical protein
LPRTRGAVTPERLSQMVRRPRLPLRAGAGELKAALLDLESRSAKNTRGAGKDT